MGPSSAWFEEEAGAALGAQGDAAEMHCGEGSNSMHAAPALDASRISIQ
jgi:hypothetical protein